MKRLLLLLALLALPALTLGARPPLVFRVEGAALVASPTLPSVAKVLTATSTSAVESCTVLLTGLGPVYASQTETLVIAGTTPVVSSLTWLRVNRAHAGAAVVGRIGITHPDTGEISAVEAGATSAKVAVYSFGPTEWPIGDTDPEDGSKCYLARLVGSGALAVKQRTFVDPATVNTLHSCTDGEEVTPTVHTPFDSDVWIEGSGAVSFDLEVPR